MYYIIVNPASRSGKGIRIWRESIRPALKAEAVPYEVSFSEQEGDVSILAQKAAAAMTPDDLLIILGGDGTFNEALQGIPDPGGVTFGYIPTGSSNDLARDLGIPKDPKKALDLILHDGSPFAMDMGTVDYGDGCVRRFAVSCGIGFDAAVCEEAMHSRLKKSFNKIGLGKLTYLGIALKQLFFAKKAHCELTLDGRPPVRINRFLFVTGMIHRYEGGGFRFCPGADPADGMLDLCAVGDIPKLLVLFALPTAFFGRHYLFKGITPYRAYRFSIKSSVPLWVHTDGEVTRRTNSFSVSCERRKLRIIVGNPRSF